MKKPIIIGICGGTGSGKSTVVEKIIHEIDSCKYTIIKHDDYYKKNDHLTMEERVKINYDHPFSLDNELLKNNIRDLQKGKSVTKPLYDFTVHNRKEETQILEPTEVIILDGILIFEDKGLRDFMDFKIFVDTDADVRILRRIKRDINDRGRTLDSVIEQYLATVKPSHEQFIEPYKKYADIIIPHGGENAVAIDLVSTKISELIK
ncbi:MAG: uridine kinase [Lachnospirales bacterium]